MIFIYTKICFFQFFIPILLFTQCFDSIDDEYIKEIQLTPNPFYIQYEKTVEVKLKIAPFEGVYDLMMNVYTHRKRQSLVFSSKVQSSEISKNTSTHIIASWDGRNNQGRTVYSGLYALEILISINSTSEGETKKDQDRANPIFKEGYVGRVISNLVVVNKE